MSVTQRECYANLGPKNASIPNPLTLNSSQMSRSIVISNQHLYNRRLPTMQAVEVSYFAALSFNKARFHV